MMIGLAASIAIVVFLVCIVFIVYALRSRAARSHISILSLIILLLIGSSLGVYCFCGPLFRLGKGSGGQHQRSSSRSQDHSGPQSCDE